MLDASRGSKSVGRLLAAAVLCGGVAAAPSAWADAPDPVPPASGNTVTNGDGSVTVTVSGNWAWTTHTSDCNLDKRAVGFAIDWQDTTQAGNVVATLNGVTIDVGVATANTYNPADNAVHPTPPIPPPSPPTYGGCGTYNPALDYNTGVWGPLSHTYPNSAAIGGVICAVTYDVHLRSNGGAPGKAKETKAGGTDHNQDNSVQANASTPGGNQCFAVVFPSTLVKAVRNVTHPPNGTPSVDDDFSTTATAQVGDILEYKLTYSNPNTTTGVVVEDMIPTNTSYVAASCKTNGSPGGCTTDGPPVTEVTWNLGTVNGGVNQVVTFRVQVAAALPTGTEIDDTGTFTTNEEPSGGSSNEVTVTIVCPPSCDDANVCTNDACDANTSQCTHTNNTVACGSSSDTACDNPDTCLNGSCQQNREPQGTLCRAAAGVCDLEEVCDGTSTGCPADAFKDSSVQCRTGSGNVCDPGEFCPGTGPNCPSDVCRGNIANPGAD